MNGPVAGDDFEAVVTVIRAWHNGAVDLEVRGVGGVNDGKTRTVRLPPAESTCLLVSLARAMEASAGRRAGD